MAAKPKLTPEEWAEVRAAWEADPRKPLAWLITELGLSVSGEALRLRSKSEGWEKGGANLDPKIGIQASKLVSSPKVGKSKLAAATATVGEAVLGDVIANAVGRPTKYRPEFSERAYELCLLGMTDVEMAAQFEVSEQTLNSWKKDFPEFLESLCQGKELADGKVARSLYQRATGASHPDTSVNVVNGVVVVTDLIKHYPPESGAAKLWLINRQPKKWRDRVEVKEDININVFPPREVLDAMYAKALGEAAARDLHLAGRRERMGITFENGVTDD